MLSVGLDLRYSQVEALDEKGERRSAARLANQFEEIGDREFQQRIQEMLEGRRIPDEIPLRCRRPVEIEIDQIRKEGTMEFRVPEQSLAKRRAGDEKKAAIYLTKKLIRLGGREVGAAFGVKAAQVTHVIRGIDDAPTSPLVRRIEGVRRRLSKG